MQVSIEEIATLLGQKDIEILVLQKQLAAVTAERDALKPKPEA
jgi:hypothetical protein